MSSRRKPSDEKLWNQIRKKWLKSSKGGDSGQWSAIKAMLASKEYKEKGGKWVGFKKEKNKSDGLRKWMDEQWDWVNGVEGGRYLPKAVRDQLTKKQKSITNKNKRTGDMLGMRVVPYEDFVLKAFKKLQ